MKLRIEVDTIPIGAHYPQGSGLCYELLLLRVEFSIVQVKGADRLERRDADISCQKEAQSGVMGSPTWPRNAAGLPLCEPSALFKRWDTASTHHTVLHEWYLRPPLCTRSRSGETTVRQGF